MARKRGTFRIFYNGLDPSGTGNPGTAWVTGRGFGAFQRPVNTVQQLISYFTSLNPLAYLPLNDPAGSTVARDITGNGYDATPTGTVQFGQPGLTAYGETSTGFTASGYLTTPPFSIGREFSIVAIHQNTTPAGSGGYQGIISTDTQTLNRSPTQFYNVFTGGDGAYLLPVNTSTNVFIQTFNAGYQNMYFNGALIDPGSVTSPVYPLGRMIIGSLALTGYVAHVAIFPYAMTAAQITALQNFITAGPVANFGGLSDAAVGPMGALSIGGPARASKGYGLVAAAASVNGTYDYLPVAGQTMPPGSTAINVTADSPLAWYEPPNSATQIAGPNPPVGFLLSTTIPKERVFFILSY